MSHAFAKDSRACAACVSWGGARTLVSENTLVEVTRYAVEGECRTAASEDYRRITKSYHPCERWAALPLLKAHGARPARTPGPAAAMAGLMTGRPAGEAAKPGDSAPVEETSARAVRIGIERAPPPARAVYGHWHRLKRERGLPAASEIDIGQVREAVPRLCLVVPAGDDFVYRTCGRAIQRQLGMRPLGTPLSACHAGDTAARMRADLAACLASGEPVAQIVRDDPVPGGSRYVELLLPLADAAGKAAFVLVYRHLAGG